MKELYLIVFLSITSLHGQVGINTSDPLEALHISSTTGTLRVESLNSVNNIYNGGDVDGDGIMSNDTFPLYVNENGDFTLKLEVLINTEAEDAFDDTQLPNSSVQLLESNLLGSAKTTIKSYTVTFNRPTLLEVKYNISHRIYYNNSYTIISDLLARRVTNYITVSPDPDSNDGITNRKYGPSSKSYTSGSTNSVTGPFFNGQTVYIKIEQAGTYTFDFVGEVSSNTKWVSSITPSSSTFIEFAVDNDFLFFRMY